MCQTPELNIGFGRRDITPDHSVPMQGYGNNHLRMSQGVLTPLLATCVAISDEHDETLLVFTVDVCDTRTELMDEIRAAITAATGVDGDRIMLSATHTHAGPDILSFCCDNMARWKQTWLTGVSGAAADAMADRRPAQLHAGSARADRLNFVRHFRLENGTFAGDNFGDFKSSPIADYADRADDQVQILRAVRKDARDILMVNWQAHPKLSSTAATPEGMKGRLLLSADYVAPFRDRLEEESGVLCAFFLGASGDVNPLSRIHEHERTTRYDEYGHLLAQTVLDALDRLQPLPPAPVTVGRIPFRAEIDHTEDHLLPYAQQIAALWEQTNDFQLCVRQGHPNGIEGPFHALSIIRRAEDNRSVEEMDLVAACAGGVGFVAAPYEMFTANGRFIKEHSPFSSTFVLTCANGCFKYIASERAFEYGCYEVHNRTFIRGTGEAFADAGVQLLRELAPSEP